MEKCTRKIELGNGLFCMVNQIRMVYDGFLDVPSFEGLCEEGEIPRLETYIDKNIEWYDSEWYIILNVHPLQ
jgi:hypothetical protein